MRCRIRCLLFFVLVAIWASSCQPSGTPAPTPAPHAIGVTPVYLEWASASLSTYRETHPGARFTLAVYPPSDGLSALEAGQIELLIGAVEPDGSRFATPLFQDGIAVIHHPGVSIRDLTMVDLRNIFSGSDQNWSTFDGDDLSIQPMIPLPGDDLRSIFQKQVMGDFRFSSLSRLSASPEQTMALIEGEPGAVGFVPFTQLGGNASAFRIDGQAPGMRSITGGTYPLVYTVAAIAPEEPVGPVREWLSWVQSEG